MARDVFEAYGAQALSTLDPTTLAGRYASQTNAERLIVKDVWSKLQIQPSDHLLEVGPGPGQICIPLSFLVERCAVVDHENVLQRLSQRLSSGQIEMLPGNFLEVEISETYDKILIYSVLHCLPNHGEVLNFVRKAARLLRPGGVMLLGDLPNGSKKTRFLATDFGRRFDEAFRRDAEPASALQVESQLGVSVTFNDESVLALLGELRRIGLDAYLVAQPDELPFGRTREDIVAQKPR